MTIVKGKGLREDFLHYDGITATGSRKDSTGGFYQGVRVGDEVDILMVYGSGTEKNNQAIQNAVTAIGSRKATIKFSPGTWDIDASVTVPANISARIPAGLTFDIDSGITLTFSGPVYSDSENIKTGSGTLSWKDERLLQSVAGTNTITASTLSTLTVLRDGQEFFLVPANTITGAATLNVNSTGAVNLRKNQSGGVVALVANDLIASNLYRCAYVASGPYYIVHAVSSYAQGADIASATTLNLDTATGDYTHVTGTTAITAITLAQGQERTVVFDGGLTLTHGASLILPGKANILAAAGDSATFRGEASGVVRCVSFMPASIAGLYNYISGFVPTPGADTDHDLSFSYGTCRNAADTVWCKPTWTTLVKQIDAAFAEGTNQGGMATGSVANSTAYYYNLIRKNSDTTVFDICIDVSSSNANTPSGWTFMREIHREFTDGSANLRSQSYREISGGGIRCKLNTIVREFQDTNPGADLVTKTLSCPPGVEVDAYVILADGSPASATELLITEVGSAATEPGATIANLALDGTDLSESRGLQIYTDSSRNIEYELDQSTADHVVTMYLYGWTNHRRT